MIKSLLGHNGAGKTTTINLLTALISKDKGKVMSKYLKNNNFYNILRQK